MLAPFNTSIEGSSMFEETKFEKIERKSRVLISELTAILK